MRISSTSSIFLHSWQCLQVSPTAGDLHWALLHGFQNPVSDSSGAALLQVACCHVGATIPDVSHVITALRETVHGQLEWPRPCVSHRVLPCLFPRAAAGHCDVAEVCTNGVCPGDGFKHNGARCPW